MFGRLWKLRGQMEINTDNCLIYCKVIFPNLWSSRCPLSFEAPTTSLRITENLDGWYYKYTGAFLFSKNYILYHILETYLKAWQPWETGDLTCWTVPPCLIVFVTLSSGTLICWKIITVNAFRFPPLFPPIECELEDTRLVHGYVQHLEVCLAHRKHLVTRSLMN